MHRPGMTQQDLHAFFEAFCQDFASFDGATVARRYATPYLALNSDGTLRHFTTPGETARYFQQHLDRYREQGCQYCTHEALESVALGQQSCLASVTWRLHAGPGQLISTWRESYNLHLGPQGLLIYVSTDHVEQVGSASADCKPTP